MYKSEREYQVWIDRQLNPDEVMITGRSKRKEIRGTKYANVQPISQKELDDISDEDAKKQDEWLKKQGIF